MYIDASTILSRCTAEVWLALPYASCKDSRNVTCRIDRVSAACCALVAAGSRIGTMDCFFAHSTDWVPWHHRFGGSRPSSFSISFSAAINEAEIPHSEQALDLW